MLGLIKKIGLVIAYVCIVANAIATDGKTEQDIESQEWLLKDDPAPPSLSLEQIIDSLIPSHCKKNYNYFPSDSIGNWIVDTVGLWHDINVVDIFFEVLRPPFGNATDSDYYKVTKAIAIETSKNNFRLIYLAWSNPTRMIYRTSEMIRVNNRQILMTRSPERGTGNFFDEQYWLWNPNKKIPVKLTATKSRDIFEKLLPPGHKIKKGGGFNISILTYSSFTWREGDGNCCPSGGKITINYEILGYKFVLKKAMFDYSSLEERAMWQAKRSEDSLYIRKDPIVFERDKSGDDSDE